MATEDEFEVDVSSEEYQLLIAYCTKKFKLPSSHKCDEPYGTKNMFKGFSTPKGPLTIPNQRIEAQGLAPQRPYHHFDGKIHAQGPILKEAQNGKEDKKLKKKKKSDIIHRSGTVHPSIELKQKSNSECMNVECMIHQSWINLCMCMCMCVREQVHI